MNEMYRQGDVLLERIGELPPDLRHQVYARQGRLILAEGEVTGHAHTVAAEHADLLRDEARNVYLRIMRATPLEHQEHAAIVLEPGVYRVVRQREYTPKAPRQVLD